MSQTTRKLQSIDAAHHLHPFTDARLLNAKGTYVIKRAADRVWLWDSDDRKLLDGMAGLWCTNIGYGRKEMVEAAKKQIEELPYYNLFFQTSHPQIIRLSELLETVTPDHMHHFFYSCSGSESNDTNLRFARHYWASVGKPEKQVIISRHNAYHGSTVAGASLGGMETMHAQGNLPIPGIEHIEQPFWYVNGADMTPDEYGLKAARALEEKILEIGENRIAAFIAEPVQGAGGVIVPPDTYWPEVKRILKKYDILLIADEVITGFGRTGKWFGSETYDLKPDLMTIAKGLSSGYAPIGAVVVSQKVADVLIHKGGELAHGYTYSGHPLCAALAVENINILRQENIIENAESEIVPYLQQRWKEFDQYDVVGETRGVGMLGAMQLCKDKASRTLFPQSFGAGKRCVELCFKHGLVMRAIKDAMVISPALSITREEVDLLMERAHAVIQDFSASL